MKPWSYECAKSGDDCNCPNGVVLFGASYDASGSK